MLELGNIINDMIKDSVELYEKERKRKLLNVITTNEYNKILHSELYEYLQDFKNQRKFDNLYLERIRDGK